jgi:Glycosyltransferase
MKIVYLYPALTTVGGADRIITEKANYLAEKCGYEVYIITAHQNGKPLFFPLFQKVKHIDLGVDFNKQYNHSFIIRGWIYFKLLRIYKRKLTKTLHSIHPDFTITTISRDIDFLTSIKDGSKKIAEAHTTKKNLRNLQAMIDKGGGYKIIGEAWTRKMEKAIRRFDALVVLTEHDAKEWKGVKNAVIIPNSLPFYPEKINYKNNRKAISIGRLEIEKGHDRLIEVWELVVKKHPDWSLDIYGEGTLKEFLLNQIKNKKIENNINIIAPVSNISEKYNESSFYIMTSRYEGFGMVLVEAMAHGLPCVSYDCPDGPRCIINDGEDGYLIKDGDVQQMVEKICYLIEHENEIKEMGKKARINVLRYKNNVIMPQWVSLFNQLK